ncbi:hypothetical protein ZIOFF_041925 [Zingiber officinale]|uniref:Uncharacterized protein n=1 Tax=Zingiber officinale TaxID=94328 RepID=A0A8J5G7Q0_ZINOF|nr:hypothetical protein ZIOFF_041925 [Zingiber officinale]
MSRFGRWAPFPDRWRLHHRARRRGGELFAWLDGCINVSVVYIAFGSLQCYRRCRCRRSRLDWTRASRGSEVATLARFLTPPLCASPSSFAFPTMSNSSSSSTFPTILRPCFLSLVLFALLTCGALGGGSHVIIVPSAFQ